MHAWTLRYFAWFTVAFAACFPLFVHAQDKAPAFTSVAAAIDPESTLLAFLNTTYGAAASLAKWDRLALERDPIAP